MNQMQQNYGEATTFGENIPHMFLKGILFQWQFPQRGRQLKIKYNNVIFKFPAYFKTFN
jgi:hypothetical protein